MSSAAANDIQSNGFFTQSLTEMGTVMSRLSRARVELKRRLAERTGGAT